MTTPTESLSEVYLVPCNSGELVPDEWHWPSVLSCRFSAEGGALTDVTHIQVAVLHGHKCGWGEGKDMKKGEPEHL